jgi:hypothetical protein
MITPMYVLYLIALSQHYPSNISNQNTTHVNPVSKCTEQKLSME